MPVPWGQRDLEGLQPVDPTPPGHGLHPVDLPPDYDSRYHLHQAHQMPQVQLQQQHNPAFTWSSTSQSWPKMSDRTALDPTTSLASEPNQYTKLPDPKNKKVLGLRKTTLALVISNILLAIGLVILGVVQNHVLQKSATTAKESCGRCVASMTHFARLL